MITLQGFLNIDRRWLACKMNLNSRVDLKFIRAAYKWRKQLFGRKRHWIFQRIQARMLQELLNISQNDSERQQRWPADQQTPLYMLASLKYRSASPYLFSVLPSPNVCINTLVCTCSCAFTSVRILNFLPLSRKHWIFHLWYMADTFDTVKPLSHKSI